MRKLLLTIDVTCTGCESVRGSNADINMVPFTAEAHGEDFTGSTVGCGVDTQRFDKTSGIFTLSARYMLEGTDREGNKCRLFIDNSNRGDGGLHPIVVTDSPALADWQDAPLTAEVIPAEDGKVTVKIYRDAE